MKGFTVVATLMLFPTLASAQNAPERGFYVGLHAGQSTFDITRFDVDDSGTAIAGVLGFRFNRYLAVEAGYADLGKGKYVAYVYPTNQVIGIVASPPEFDVSVRGPTAGIAAFLPLGRRFELHLGAGAFFSKLTEHAPLNASDSSVAAYSGHG